MSVTEFSSIANNYIWAVGYSLTLYFIFIFISMVWVRSPHFSKALTDSSNRFGCLDGLRGVLAVGVFVHHSYVGYLYFITGTWSWSNSPVIDNMGQATVALFFMITAFLFTTKLINSDKRLSFFSIYVGRVFRLSPLYFIVVSFVILFVALESGWKINEPPAIVGLEVLKWYMFVLFGRPDINGMESTSHIIAGVNWTLRFEWLFYLSLPVIYFALKALNKYLKLENLGIIMLACVVLSNIFLTAPGGVFYIFCYFILGMASAMLAPQMRRLEILEKRWVCIFPVMAILLVFTQVNSFNLLSILSLFMILLFVINGYSYFGFLKSKSLIWLGDISYGIYLIHGIILYSSYSIARNFHLFECFNIYWFFALMCFDVLVIFLLSSISYRYMELPLMKISKNIKFQFKL